MGMNYFKKRKLLKDANYLDLVPVRSCNFESDQAGKVTLLIPKFKSDFLRRMLVPRRKSPDFRIKLDELGSAVWLAADGIRNVAEISALLVETMGEKVAPAEERIPKFLSILFRQGFINFKQLIEAVENKRG